MKKTEQREINGIVMYHFGKALQEYYQEKRDAKHIQEGTRLRSCQAWVYETENYFLLQSYNTFIACMDKRDFSVYDALRHEYGYTSTSAQHIAKFGALTCYGGYKKEYGNKRFTWRAID